MAHYSLELLNRLSSDWKEQVVDVVTFPAPPVPAKGCLYAEDCWRSSALETATDMLQSKGKSVISAKFTNRGPAFLIRHRLGDLLMSDYGDAVTVNPIYCATIGYTTILETNELLYANDATLDSMLPISRSCHPGSHTCVPGAPMLTALLQVTYATDDRELPHDFVFADHVTGQKYFPEHDFSQNIGVDDLFKYMTIQDCVGQVKQVEMYPVLSTRLTELIFKQLQPNGHFRLKYPDIGKYIDVVTQFQQQLKGDYHG